jgi:hypothetical protein
MMRRVWILFVVVVGVAAVTATSGVDEPAFVVTSPQKSIALTLDQQRPEARFLVDVASTVDGAGAFLVRSEVDVADDDVGDDDNDGVAVIDVGLFDVGGDFPDDVDAVGDASVASVKEGAFGVERGLDGSQVVLAARLREGVDRADVTFLLTASTTVAVAPPGDQGLTLEVSPDTRDDEAP